METHPRPLHPGSAPRRRRCEGGELSGASPSPEEFRGVIGRFASGVTVITVESGGRPLGTTASAVSSLSLEPPMVLICMNRSSTTGAAVAAERRFAINILGEDQVELARRFATKDPDKFAGAELERGAHGQPLLGGALATIECEVVDEVTGGTHTVFLGEVRSAASAAGTPLTYFGGEFGRFAAHAGDPTPGAPVAVADLEAAIDACAAIEIGATEVALAGPVEPAALAARLPAEGDAIPATVGMEAFERDTLFFAAVAELAGSAALAEAYGRIALPALLAEALEADPGKEPAADRAAVRAALASGRPADARAAIFRRADRLKRDLATKLGA